MRTSALLVALVFSFVATASPVGAQTAHSAPQSAIDAALQQKVSSGAADREAVLRLLERPEVEAVAGEAGLDLRRAKDAVSTMTTQDVASIAAQASQVEQALAGGQSRITLNTTLLILGLLVLIILILALK
jgi:hypothetical protein